MVDQPHDRDGRPLAAGQLVTILGKNGTWAARKLELRHRSIIGRKNWLVFVAGIEFTGFWSDEIMAVDRGLKHLVQRYKKEEGHG